MSTNEQGARRIAAVAVAGLVHVGVLWWLTIGRSTPAPDMQTLMDLSLEPPLFSRPIVPPPSSTAPETAGGSGAQPSPSVVHRPAEVFPNVETVAVAPVEPAPEQPLNLSVAASNGAERGEGVGLSGSGSGAGAGSGEGAGSASGVGAGPVPVRVAAQLIRRPSEADIRASYPIAARPRALNGRAVIACRVRLDTRLDHCQVLQEDPTGVGFGRAGLELAARYRFRPPSMDGRPVEGQTVTFAVDYVRS